MRTSATARALVHLPSVVLLVSGSVAFRGLATLMERDYTLGMDAAVAVLRGSASGNPLVLANALAAMVAGAFLMGRHPGRGGRVLSFVTNNRRPATSSIRSVR